MRDVDECYTSQANNQKMKTRKQFFFFAYRTAQHDDEEHESEKSEFLLLKGNVDKNFIVDNFQDIKNAMIFFRSH